MQADVYTDSSGVCAAFLSNSDNKTDSVVKFRNMTYHLPAWSVSILPDCKNVVYNTAKVSFCLQGFLSFQRNYFVTEKLQIATFLCHAKPIRMKQILCMQFHQVGSQTSVIDMVPEELQPSVVSPDKDLESLQWEVFLENPGTWGYPDFNITGFVDNINTTKDITDYLWVTARFGRDNSKMHLPSFILFSIVIPPF